MSVLKFWLKRRGIAELSSPSEPSKKDSTSQSARKRRKLPPRKKGQTNGRWTAKEHKLFVEAYKQFGRDWKKVEQYLPSRSSTQIRSHAQRYLAKMERENALELQQLAYENMGTLLKAPSVIESTLAALQSRYKLLATILERRKLRNEDEEAYQSDNSFTSCDSRGSTTSTTSDDMSLDTETSYSGESDESVVSLEQPGTP